MSHIPESFLCVMAGGNGTRFWPKSTSHRPKQLLSFGQKSSLLSLTLSRFSNLIQEDHQMILTTKALSTAIQTECPNSKLLIEPQARNTAPCLYWAAQMIAESNPKAVMVIVPSDHLIPPPYDSFENTIRKAIEWAKKKNDLVTLGIVPSRPETGYGYLKTQIKPSPFNQDPFIVESFIEKPNLERAIDFLKDGNYFWNGGMFIWRAEIILQAFEKFMPEMQIAWKNSKKVIENAYPHMTATSIDFGIMEKAKNVVTFPLECPWDDLGSWISLESLGDQLGLIKDNNILNAGNLVSIDSQNNIVDAPEHLIALLGVEDLIVVQSNKVLLVAKKEKAQEIKKLVEKIKIIEPGLA